VITPRRTRLVRVASLRSFRRVIVNLVRSSPAPAESVCVVVPTEEAAVELAEVFDRDANDTRARPDLVTREQLHDRFFQRLPNAPRRLTTFEREVLLQASAQAATEAGAEPPFRLRPGLVAEMLRFYDQLRRQRQTVARFSELVTGAMSGDDDRGAARLQQQTRFLAAAYTEYELRLARASAVDEHGIRERAMAVPADKPLEHVIVAVGDWIAETHGLFAADFDVLTRVPDLRAIDVVATERLLASGFHERLHTWLPGLEEVNAAALGIAPASAPTQLVPEAAAGTEAPLVFACRDREEELIRIARRVADEHVPPSSAAIVFGRPLPYLYMAPEVFGGAGLLHQTSEGLPLAGEPAAAALDLVIEFVSSQFSRSATTALLRSAQLQFGHGGERLSRSAVGAFDRLMIKRRYAGGLDALRDMAGLDPSPASAAANVAVDVAAELEPLLTDRPASLQLTSLATFFSSHGLAEGLSERETSARDTVLAILTSMAAACAAHGDRPVTIDELAPEIRRWVEDHTLRVRRPPDGIRLLGAQAARFADVDELHIVGAIEHEWPEPVRRNIFYPQPLLASIGWPSEQDRRGAAAAAFLDLVCSPSRFVSVSAFLLDDDAVVEPSSLLEDLHEARLSSIAVTPSSSRVFIEEALSLEPARPDALADADARDWLAVRAAQPDGADVRYHGEAGPRMSQPLSVSAIEMYLTCPFKFFAQHVLRLEEDPDDEDVLDPRTQGRLVHKVFETFFSAWQAQGRGAITSETIGLARELFATVVETCLAGTPDAEAALERTRLLGSSVAAGLGDTVFRMEAERPVAVVERLLEHPLNGEFIMTGPDGPRTVKLKGIADRLDLLADGTFRLIDYKLSSPPSKSRALQLPIYGLCAEQRLDGRAGRRWVLGEAAYIAFRGPKRVVPLFTARSSRDEVLAAAQARLIAAVDGIERGSFPPTPEDAFLCGFCAYGTVCRKEYVGDV